MTIPAGVHTVDVQQPIRSIHVLEMPDDKDGLRLVGAAIDELRQHRSAQGRDVSHKGVLHLADFQPASLHLHLPLTFSIAVRVRHTRACRVVWDE